MTKIWPWLVSMLLLAACGAQPVVTNTTVPPTDTPAPAAKDTPTAEGQARNLPSQKGDLFSTSGICAACHTQMMDQAGTDVSTDAFWRGSMMANAARDPYWQASVRGEILSNPAYQPVIEDKCSTCHMPMARFTAASQQREGKVLDDGFIAAGNPLHALAMDGVSCNLCHQIRDEGFGQHQGFSGGYAIDTALPVGDREAFGPYPMQPGLVQVMQASSGFVPKESAHVEQSELCATCHTLYTPYVDAAGQIAGEFPEQTPYLEWLNSDYRDSRSCQDCHMPLAQGGVQLSVTGGPKRSPFFQHVFVGGNAYVLEMLRTFGQDLAVTASEVEFQDKKSRAAEQLQTRTATIALESVNLSGSTLAANVVVTNQSGHKFPTGFPSRRAWIHLAVRDAAGQVIFASGEVQADGAITGDDGDTDAARYEPHYETIDSADQVQIYESIMGDTEGGVTMILLRASGYLKDNRLLPLGLDKIAAEADIAVHGSALEDADFGGGGDRVAYRIDVGDAPGPFTVTAELLYQSIGYRWAEKLRPFDAAEATRFLDYYGAVPNRPVVVASATTEIGK